MGRFLGITVKRGSRVGVWMGTLKNPTKCLWRGINPFAHLCAVTYMTEISLNVLLNNHIHSLRVQRLRNDLYKVVKGRSISPIVLSMIAGSY